MEYSHSNPTIILIGNYPRDRDPCVERFTGMLSAGIREAGFRTETWRPGLFLGRLSKSTDRGIGKWLGWFDKWILFPMVLRWRVFRLPPEEKFQFHICDQANAPYLPCFPRGLTGITCHEMLSIRGRKRVLGNLKEARNLAAATEAAMTDLKRLAGPQYPLTVQDWRVIPHALEGNFHRMEKAEAWKLLMGMGLSPNVPFVLHVGTGHPWENSRMLLNMVHQLGNRWQGQVCFAGSAPDADLLSLAGELGLASRIVVVEDPVPVILTALYSACAAFIFPSHAGGFAWPLIEAQACGAPVIASKRKPMPEITGGSAIHEDPDDAKAFAAALIALNNEEFRKNLVELGYSNCERYEPKLMMRAYLDLHSLPPRNPAHPAG